MAVEGMKGKSGGGQTDSEIIIQLVNELIIGAARANASDIHLEPQDDEVIVRYRIDGMLQVKKRIPSEQLQQIVARIKIMAGLDVTEHRLPLDGRIDFGSVGGGSPVDLRLSTVPTLTGEKCCIRVIYKAKEQTDLDHLGYSEANLPVYKSIVESPNGLLLHVGPAGSGKTSSIYAAIRHLNQPGRNISTVEDPVEYRVQRVNQVQINPDVGLTFARVLRAFMRQDCNVILVGEIRDSETCEIAIEAALTGHMIMGTLHATSSVGTIARLQELGITNYFIGSALRGVVSQRLVRRLCVKCKQPTPPPRKLAEALNMPIGQPIFRSVGCGACGNQGYKGRACIHEVLKPNEKLRQMIFDGAPPSEMEAGALDSGMIPLWIDGLEKAKAGDTSLEEVTRVVHGVTAAGGGAG